MICFVVGARPNFIKMTPLVMEARRRNIPHLLVHTGQHYDMAMSDVFFQELHIPQPDIHLKVGSGSHAEQTARIMIGFEQVCLSQRPDLVVVAGDVNSTLACALTAAKLEIPVAHLEAGLRSFDRSMPEEINRILTDKISDILLTTEPSGTDHLRQEGIPDDSIHFVGNCMIDMLRANLETSLKRRSWERFGFSEGRYGLITLHRPAMVDDLVHLDQMRKVFQNVSGSLPLVFPVHPRTRKHIASLGHSWDPIVLTDPMGYLDFLCLMAKARIVITDSGGIQEETTSMGVPCVTVRDNTERPITVTVGTNRLAGTAPGKILACVHATLSEDMCTHTIPELWDGKAAVRAMNVIEQWISRRGQER